MRLRAVARRRRLDLRRPDRQQDVIEDLAEVFAGERSFAGQ